MPKILSTGGMLLFDTGDADLCNANLCNANLRNADLRGADLCNANLCNADLRSADLRNAYLCNAGLRNTDLSFADLSHADLGFANLRNADLSFADLRDADLSHANLRNADLRGAKLHHAHLSRADLRGAQLADYGPIVVPSINSVILEKVESDGAKLDMSVWHGSCGATHCLAGWAVYAAGRVGWILEHDLGTEAAAAIIFAVSSPNEQVPDFFAYNEDALQQLKERASKESGINNTTGSYRND